jgi:hypothetical protein
MTSDFIYQTDLPHPYNKYGCNFRSLQAMAEVITTFNLDKSRIMFLAEHCKSKTYLGNSPGSNIYDVYVWRPEEVVNSSLAYLGDRRTVWNCGCVKNGQAVGWNGAPLAPDKYDYSIIKLFQEDLRYRHFVLGTKEFTCLWDPTPNSKSVQLWSVKDVYLYRII